MTEPWETDLIYARDAAIVDASCLTPLPELEWWWFHCLDYQHDGAAHRILPIQQVRRRRYGACGDAAAHLLAAAARQGIRAQLCIEEPANVAGYRHVRVYLPAHNRNLDPYASLRPKVDDDGRPLAASCERMLDL